MRRWRGALRDSSQMIVEQRAMKCGGSAPGGRVAPNIRAERMLPLWVSSPFCRAVASPCCVACSTSAFWPKRKCNRHNEFLFISQ